MFAEYASYDATGLAELVATGQVTAAELLEAALARAEATRESLNAICTPMHGVARERTKEPLSGPFAGVPFLIKDIAQDYAGVATMAGSRAFAARVPEVHAEIVARFLRAGLVIFGKTSTPELALKAVTEPELHGPTRNPWSPDRTPGGSSGGAASAVAAGVVPMAGASDGGGSIRIPASFCGLFGLRPSRGRVPCGPAHGEFWEGASSEHVLTRSVRDSARMLDAISGPDVGAPFDIAPPERPFAAEVGRPTGKLRIGYCTRSPLGTHVDRECVVAVENAVTLLRELGHEVVAAEPEVDGEALAASFMTMYFGQVAASVAHARQLTGAHEDAFELDTRALALLGRSLPAGEYVTAHRRWNDYARALGRFFGQYDFYLTPTVAMPPARIGELALPSAQRAALKVVLAAGLGKALLATGIVGQLARENLMRTPFTQLSNLTGTPSMSVPLHMSPEGLPVGVHFSARFGQEGALIRLAAALEQAAPWQARRPRS
jgi:amidase